MCIRHTKEDSRARIRTHAAAVLRCRSRLPGARLRGARGSSAGPERGLAQAAPGRHRPGDPGASPGAPDHRERERRHARLRHRRLRRIGRLRRRRLRRAGLAVRTQTFTFDFFQETGPSSFSRTSDDPDTVYEEGTSTTSSTTADRARPRPVQPVDMNTADPSDDHVRLRGRRLRGLHRRERRARPARHVHVRREGRQRRGGGRRSGDHHEPGQRPGADGRPRRHARRAGRHPGDQRLVRPRPRPARGRHDRVDHDADR